jgi:hypothetical protein
MKRSVTLIVAAALGAGTLCISREASALGPIDLEVAARAGAGTNPFSGPNPLGFGIGARGGVAFLGFYGGLSFIYYFGSGQDLPLTGHVSETSVLYGIEAGYGTKLLDLITLRGQLGLGNLTISSNISGTSSNGSNLYLEPGVLAEISVGMILVGADANVLLLPGVADPVSGGSSWKAAFTAHGQVGVKF